MRGRIARGARYRRRLFRTDGRRERPLRYDDPITLLTVSGSLRAASSNVRAIEAIARLAPADWVVRARRPLDELPFFNPDVEQAGLPDAARQWREEVGSCDALVISSPEYAHGVPGVLKNALDWLVGGIEITGKPIALVNATPPAAFAHAQLRETLTVIGARVIETASIELPLRGRATDVAAILADAEFSARIATALAALAAAATTTAAQP